MKIIQEELQNRINYMCLVSNLMSNQDKHTVFQVHVMEDVDQYGADVQHVVVMFFDSDDGENAQTFFGEADDYDDYEELINDIGDAFFKTHTIDSYINFYYFRTYMDTYYYLGTLLQMEALPNRAGTYDNVVDALSKKLTKADIATAVCDNYNSDNDFTLILNTLCDSNATRFVRAAANAFDGFPDLVMNTADLVKLSQNTLDERDCDDYMTISEFIRQLSYTADIEFTANLAKAFIAALVEPMRNDLLERLCMKMPVLTLKTALAKLDVGNDVLVTYLDNDTFRDEIVKHYGKDFEHEWYETMFAGVENDDDAGYTRQMMS